MSTTRVYGIHENTLGELTLAFHASPVNAGAADHHVMYDSEDALAANPSARFTFNLAVVEYSSLVKLHASTMYSSGERNLVRMKIFPARSPHYILWRIAQDVSDRV